MINELRFGFPSATKPPKTEDVLLIKILTNKNIFEYFNEIFLEKTANMFSKPNVDSLRYFFLLGISENCELVKSIVFEKLISLRKHTF